MRDFQFSRELRLSAIALVLAGGAMASSAQAQAPTPDSHALVKPVTSQSLFDTNDNAAPKKPPTLLLPGQPPDPRAVLDPPQSYNLIPSLPTSAMPQVDAITLFPDVAEAQPVPEQSVGFGYVLHGSARATYDSNIFIQPRNEQEDYIFTLAPGIALGWGDFKSEIFSSGSFRDRFDRDRAVSMLEKDYIYVDYVPSITGFSDHTDENSVDHDAVLEGQVVLQRLTLGVNAHFQTLNLPDADVGDRVEQRRFSGGITSLYNFSQRTSFEVNVYTYLRDFKRNVDTTELRNEEWINFQATSKIQFGVGFAVGHLEPSSGPSQTYEEGVVRVRYKATEKFTFSATAGVDYRQVQDSNDRTNGIFALGVTWNPYDGTYFNLQAARRTHTSASQAQNYTATSVDLRVRQRLFHRLYVGFAGGYQNSEYDGLICTPEAAATPGRTDNLYYLRPSIGVDVTTWLSCEASIEYRSNDSTNEKRGFDDLLTYVQLNVLF